jgi:O-antigen/teichoic acid export membrane protein
MLPLFLTAGLVGEPLIPLIFGPQWLPAVVPFQVIAVTAALGGAVLYVPVIMLCYGRASIGLLADFLNTAATLTAIWFLGQQFGALGAALALLLRLLVDAAIQFWCLAHLHLFPLPAMARDYLATLFGVLPLLAGAGLLYGGAVTGLVQQLALGLGCGMLSVVMIALCSRSSVVSLRSLVTGEG